VKGRISTGELLFCLECASTGCGVDFGIRFRRRGTSLMSPVSDLRNGIPIIVSHLFKQWTLCRDETSASCVG